MAQLEGVLLEGILAVNKPAGWTSHDVVAKLRRILKQKRIGHAGTLDPDVTGVLPVAIGRSTRFIEYLQEMPKEYVAEMTIGMATDTEDISGTVIAQTDEVNITRDDIHSVIARFIGEIEQVPPMYSAVKVKGRRLYELAREGIVVERKPRKVTIHEISIEHADLSLKHPVIRMRVLCSKGTYIRTLCKDIGEELGVPAVMSRLERTMSCGLTLADSVTLEQIESWHKSGQLASHIVAVDQVITHLPALHVDEPIAHRLLHGQRVNRRDLGRLAELPRGEVRIYSVADAPANTDAQASLDASANTDGPASMDAPASTDVQTRASGERFIGICRIEDRLIIPHKMLHT